jgi:alkaline phosphatase D
VSCRGSLEGRSSPPSEAETVAAAAFSHGVASGDPLHDRVVLWTRSATRAPKARVAWEVSKAPSFAEIEASGETETDASADYTVKVDAAGLQPGTTYHYRFRLGDSASPVGRTRTLARGSIERLRLAVVSCSNYTTGFFNVYAAIAGRSDLDAVLHLGDYIYEYASDHAKPALRGVAPKGEIVSLADYRQRYASYRGDPDLQEVHRLHPFIAVWDRSNRRVGGAARRGAYPA